ncbi:Avo1 protein [Starmerella bacillaris]|uniref:Avo1 protein n=1 Tax=Starmerella bacillaris TaxID=1247836 RepID=A0AAV5RJN9_STABA|nr:Avo1 protein [Starmerella bacillaris]
MALLFRNERVIENLRSAYLSQRHEDSLLAVGNVSNTNEFDSDMLDSLKLDPDQTFDNTIAAMDTDIESISDADPETLKSLELRRLELDFDDDSDFDGEILPIGAAKYTPSRKSSRLSSPQKGLEPHVNVFAKRDTVQLNLHSQLSEKLHIVAKDPRDQYLEAIAGIPAGGGLLLKMHFANNKFIEITVRQDCTTHLALGYAIYKAGIKPGDANMYNLHLAEDDGSPDDDFPSLDRRRLVSSYHVDELAVVRATEKEYLENSKQTPNKISFSKSKSAKKEAAAQLATVGAGLTSPSINKLSINQIDLETVTVKMFMHPYDPLLSQPFWVKSMVSCQSKIADVFQHMCWEKMMDTEMFILRAVDTDPPAVVNMQQGMVYELVEPKISKKDMDVHVLNLEIVARRNLTGPMAARKNSVLKSPRKAEGHTNDLLENAVMAMQPLGFYKYPVIRRQQMNFLGRSERELIIDGDYIHLMPPADWSVLDQPKTTTFHIKQVLRVKRSSKVVTNLSIIIMKPTGPKRYDLECQSASVALEIIDKLQRLKATIGRAII